MSKTTDKTKSNTTIQKDEFKSLDAPEVWDIVDPQEQAFWDEFFKIEEMLELHDNLDPTTFSITIQNQKTGEVRSYDRVRLLSTKRKIRC